MLRYDIEFPNIAGPNKVKKIDITVIDRNHNGLAIVHYISENLNIYPQLKPLFFIIKSLTCHYKLYDPKNGGIRTYAIIIMILSYLQSLGASFNNYTLGQHLLRFLFFFAFEYQYGYAPESELRQDVHL
jgi:DNA polymerase sigma